MAGEGSREVLQAGKGAKAGSWGQGCRDTSILTFIRPSAMPELGPTVPLDIRVVACELVNTRLHTSPHLPTLTFIRPSGMPVLGST